MVLVNQLIDFCSHDVYVPSTSTYGRYHSIPFENSAMCFVHAHVLSTWYQGSAGRCLGSGCYLHEHEDLDSLRIQVPRGSPAHAAVRYIGKVRTWIQSCRHRRRNHTCELQDWAPLDAGVHGKTSLGGLWSKVKPHMHQLCRALLVGRGPWHCYIRLPHIHGTCTKAKVIPYVWTLRYLPVRVLVRMEYAY